MVDDCWKNKYIGSSLIQSKDNFDWGHLMLMTVPFIWDSNEYNIIFILSLPFMG